MDASAQNIETTPMNWRRSRYVAVLAVAIAACGSDEPETLDPTATYEVYGERFEPGMAIPAQAILAEPQAFLGRRVILDGLATNECPEPECLTAIAPGSTGQIRVFLHPHEGDTLDVPHEITGRRIVVSGTLEAGADSTYRLHATGLMTEKIRR